MTLAVAYDPFDPETLSDPYPVYAKLREQTPVFWHEQMQSWVVTRYVHCRDVLRDYDLFARDRRRVGEDVPEFRQSLQSLDPPAQKPLRSLLVNSFRAQDLDQAADQARQQISKIFDRLRGSGTFDWMAEVAAPVALRVTADLLGVERPDGRVYATLSEAIAERMDAGLRPDAIEHGDKARRQLNEMVEIWFEGPERPGVLSDVRRRAPGAGVPEHYIRNSAGMMFNASYGTVFAMAGNVALTLLRHPDALEQLRDDDLLTTGVDELIRFDGPAQGTSRVAMRRTTIGSMVIERGQTVVTLLAAANRDPDEFDRPDELVLSRSPNRHLGFGWGSHACLGAMFGHVAIREIVRCLADHRVPLRLAGAPIRRRTATVRSIDVLPVTFGH